jgi:hypothetical protein
MPLTRKAQVTNLGLFCGGVDYILEVSVTRATVFSSDFDSSCLDVGDGIFPLAPDRTTRRPGFSLPMKQNSSLMRRIDSLWPWTLRCGSPDRSRIAFDIAGSALQRSPISEVDKKPFPVSLP